MSGSPEDNDNIVRPTFNRRAIPSRAPENGEAEIKQLFAGSSAGAPDLFGRTLMDDILGLIEQYEAQSTKSIHIVHSVKKQAIRAVYDDLKEGEIKFYLRHDDKEDTPRDTAPFMVLQARHQKDYDQPGKINVLFNLKKIGGIEGRRSVYIAKGHDFKTDIAPYLSQVLANALVTSAHIDAATAYKAWTPN